MTLITFGGFKYNETIRTFPGLNYVDIYNILAFDNTFESVESIIQIGPYTYEDDA